MSEKLPFGIQYTRIMDWLGAIVLALVGIFMAMIAVPNFMKAAEDAGKVANPVPLIVVGLISFGIAMFPGGLLIWLAKTIARGSKAARIWQIIVSCFALLIFPVGTILHGVVLYFMLIDKNTKAVFASNYNRNK